MMIDELPALSAAGPGLPGAVIRRIEECLRDHFPAAMVTRISGALQRGEMVQVGTGTDACRVAYRRGVLSVGERDYVIDRD